MLTFMITFIQKHINAPVCLLFHSYFHIVNNIYDICTKAKLNLT